MRRVHSEAPCETREGRPEKKHCPGLELEPEPEQEPEQEPDSEATITDQENEEAEQEPDAKAMGANLFKPKRLEFGDESPEQEDADTMSSFLDGETDAKCQEQKTPSQLTFDELITMSQPELRRLYTEKSGLSPRAMRIGDIILAIAKLSMYPSDVMARIKTFCDNYTHKGPEMFEIYSQHYGPNGFNARTDKHVLALALTDMNIHLEPMKSKCSSKKPSSAVPRWLNKETIDSLSIEHLALLKSLLEDAS